MLTDLSNINVLDFYVTIGAIVLFVLLLVLFLRSGHRYSVHDTEAHSTNFAGVIKEGHGGMTAFLWSLFTAFFIWTIAYFVIHASEFSIIFVH
jgi:hypothetical protein